tara:strand:- start:3103 stop:3309 length:207 start_codon:yes stop_codon:yes gene_type:complete
MNEDHLNLEIRKFLKKVGITSQREIEKSIYSSEKKGIIKINDDIDLEVILNIKKLNTSLKIEGKIKIQ